MTEVTTDGRAVWVNSKEGFCIGRFSPILGEVLDPTLGLRGVREENFGSWIARLKANWPEVEVGEFQDDLYLSLRLMRRTVRR